MRKLTAVLTKSGAMLLGSTILCSSGTALAQQANTDNDDDIVVTASKREQNLQDVPMAISAIGTERLSELQVKEFQDVVKFLPSVTIQTAAPGFAQVYFRGVASGENANHSASLPTVGTYLDEMPVTTIQGALDIHAYDLARVEALAAEISGHFRGTDKLVVIGLLRGSFIFIADLVREIELPVEVDFLEVSSYGNATESSREVRILKDLRGEIEGRDLLVVEDIIDTGRTLRHVLDILATRHPKRIEVCALLDKPSRREVEVKARWIGFEIPDKFVVGYGIDYAQRNRNLPHIGAVRFEG